MPANRPVRRRGRAPHAADSDDDIVRDVQTDSDDDHDDLSDDSDDSDDDDSEPVSRHLTPNTSHSPDDKPGPPFFAATPAAWSDMVDEVAPQLPVINFADFDAHTVRKVRMAAPASPSSDDDPDADQPVASSSSHHSPTPPFQRRPPGQSARQAYQHRLESDPSFVPTVGEFWGHDDRLLDKDLRSLSGWWRGRWQGRGRARGVLGPRGRGRGGFAAPQQQQPWSAPDADSAPQSPMDRTWTHDGFEEMKRREDHRQQPSFRGAFRGGFVPGRGRGSGAFLSARAPGRIWYAMKPEHMWTKQHEGYLYFDPALKGRPGQPPGFRVHLPGTAPEVVRAPPRPHRPAKAVPKAAAPDVEYTVRLPRRAGKERATAPSAKPKQSKALTLEAVTVRPRATPAPVPAPAPAPAAAPAAAAPEPVLEPEPVRAPSPSPTHAPWAPLQPDADGWVRADPAAAASALALPVPVPIPVASPPTNPSPALASPPPPPFAPYPAYPPLPLGVGLNQHGMPYELATGRPVFLQPPPPVQVFPAYIHPAHGHAHSHSIGHAHSHSVPVAGPDPAIFAFARGARVEIRAPDTKSDATPAEPPADGASGKKLRTGAAAFEPREGYFPAGAGAYDNSGGGGAGMMYAPPAPAPGYVPTQYYYPYAPAPAPYGEQPPPPGAQYELYPGGTVYY